MCLVPKPPKPTPVQARPRRDENASIVQDNRRAAAEQQGVYSNIVTSPLGDSAYGENVQKLAKFGGR